MPCLSRAAAAPGSSEDELVDEGLVLLLVGAILAASIVVALGAARTGVPVLVAFLGLGMLLGSDGPGGIEFDDAELARDGRRSSASRLILYEGGLCRPRGAACARSRSRRRCSARSASSSARSLTGRRRARALRPLLARGDPARRRRRVDRRGRRVRDAPLHAHPPAARAHARGGVGRQRPDGDRAHARPDRVDRAARRLRVRRSRRARRPADRARARRRRRARSGRRRGSSRGSRSRSAPSRRSRRSPPPRSRSASPT